MRAVSDGTSVLIVEDSLDYCALIVRAFRRLSPGVGVFPFHDGAHAIEHLRGCGQRWPLPGLVLLDRRLPEGPDGFEILSAARQMAALAAVPIWMLSATHEPEHVSRAHELGADEYIGKPTGDRYQELVHQILARQPWRRGQPARAASSAESWPRSGPVQARSVLALRPDALQCPAMPAHALDSPAGSGSQDERSFGDRFLDALGWLTRKAEESLDPFQLALARVCRKHHLTTVQLMQKGGSQSLVTCRHGALVDLLAERWPEETLLTVVSISERDMKRLRAAVREREKVGPNLALGKN